MAKHALKTLTALGHDAPEVVTIGRYRITESFDVALASLASRRGREKDVAKIAKAAKLPAGCTAESTPARLTFVLALN